MRPKRWVTLSDGSILTRQEQFVLRQVEAGEVADLKKFGEAEETRRLRARFLEELLTGELPGVEMNRRGLRVRNAIIAEQVSCENAEANSEIWLNDCIFTESVSFRDGRFKYHFSVSGSHFLMDADFHRIKVGGGFYCHKTTFSSWVDFSEAAINGPFSADRSGFLDKHYEANFKGIKIGQDASFDESQFLGSADFGGAQIAGELLGRRTKFLREAYKINFNHLQVGKSVHLDAAEFHGPVDFSNINVPGQFVATGAKFLSKDYKVSFYGMQVGQDAFFQGADFHGLVSFQVKIAGDLHLGPRLKLGQEISATFHSSVNFHGAEIGGEFWAEKAHFLGHISNFEAMRVGRSFHASGAIFGGSVNFTEMQVRNNFYIDPFGRMKGFKTLFKGAANFSRAEVAGVFNADQAIFQSESTIFSGLKVGLGAFFNGTIFFGGLVLKEGQLTDLVVRGLHRLSKGGLPLTEIVLNRTRIKHRLTIEDVEIKKFEARNLEVQGPAELRRLFIRKEADLRDAALHHFQMVETYWPPPQDGHKRVYLDGLTFESITSRKEADKPEDWSKLLAWLSLSRFNTQNYRQLDAFCQRGGLRQWADKVHIAGKRRGLKNIRWWHPARWLARFFWDMLAGYGRKPGRTLAISLFLTILGAFILNPVEVLAPEFLNHLAGFQDNLAHRIALRLIVSFANFVSAIPGWGGQLPLHSLGFHTFVFLWFQRICGWILVPIGLAAIYTSIKREKEP